MISIPGLDIHYHEPLARYTAARLGGPADVLAIAHTPEALLEAVLQAEGRWIVLGAGANVLVADAGFRGTVIINRARRTTIDADSGRVHAESGATLSTLARRAMRQGLHGLEWCVSVPGTVGGAVVNNAGAHGSDMADSLVQVTMVDLQTSTTSQVWPVERLEYDYRHSIIKGQRQRYLILDALLVLDAGHDPAVLEAFADEFVAHRKRTQPPGASLGSIFKNPPGDYAGRLIDAAGLKGHRIGGVEVSPLHANFFINLGEGTASDYNELIRYTQLVVAEQSGIHLELEIERIGFEGA